MISYPIKVYNLPMKVQVVSGKIGVAVSGGKDSMTLLSLYLAQGVKPIVLNVEHGIRGERSVQDSEFVVDFAKRHGLTCITTSVDAPKYAKEHKVSIELAARELRYAFFDHILAEKKVDVIALAHHADDNAETVLMRIFRGTGLKGLRGIVDRDGYIHPLIRYTRREIDEYVEANAVPYVEDESNYEDCYARNFIRNRLLPEIEKRYPEAVRAIGKLSESAADDYEYLASESVLPREIDDGYVLKKLFSSPDTVQRYSVKSALFEMGVTKDLEKSHLIAILALKEKENNASVDLPFGVVAEKFGQDLYLVKKRTEKFVEQDFCAEKEYVFRGYAYTFVKGDSVVKGETVDPDKVSGCVVRERRDGDVFTKVNGKRKLLSDYLNEKKLVKHQKDALLVLAKGNVVYAVLGLETADEAKAEQNYLWIKKEKRDL